MSLAISRTTEVCSKTNPTGPLRTSEFRRRKQPELARDLGTSILVSATI